MRVEQGALQGVWVLGAAGTEIKFAAFRGVPYAAPPIGSLRFKVGSKSTAPQPQPDMFICQHKGRNWIAGPPDSSYT